MIFNDLCKIFVFFLARMLFIISFVFMKGESILQAQFFKLASNDPYFRYCIWSTPNGIYLSGNMAAINEMKSTGALAGVWDLTIQKDGELFFIETKIGTNQLTKEQKHFKKVRIENGIPESNFFVYRTLEEGMEILETIKNKKKLISKV